MQIICKKCNSKLNIPEEKIPSNGAKGKCPKCKSQILIPPYNSNEEVNQSSISRSKEELKEKEFKKCPYCKEKILMDAEKCKWCQSHLNQAFEDKAKKNIAKANETIIRSNFYQKYWSEWDIGEKIVCSSIVLAITSLFFSWSDIGIMSQNGWQQQGYFLLLCFAYPAYTLVKKKKPNIYISYIISLLSTGLIAWYINTKTVEMHNSTVNASGMGSWIFLASTLLLGYGFFRIGQESNVNKKIILSVNRCGVIFSKIPKTVQSKQSKERTEKQSSITKHKKSIIAFFIGLLSLFRS